jgi:hypothetical protein
MSTGISHFAFPFSGSKMGKLNEQRQTASRDLQSHIMLELQNVVFSVLEVKGTGSIPDEAIDFF